MASEAAARMSEADLDKAVRRIVADLPQLRAYHTHDSRRSASGFPDWVIVGPRGVLWRELKRQAGKLTDDQMAWMLSLIDAGQDAHDWRPSDLLAGHIAHELALLAGFTPASWPKVLPSSDYPAEEVTSVNDPEAEQVAADQDAAAEASQDDPHDHDGEDNHPHEANPF